MLLFFTCIIREFIRKEHLHIAMVNKLKVINLTLYIVRIYVVSVIPPGYIHPDEHFQSTEIAANDILNLKAVRTWEWNNTYPVRNVLFPYITAGLPFWLLDLARVFLDIQLSTYILILLPRCVMLIFIHMIERMAIRMLELGKTRRCTHELFLFVFRTSYISIVFLNRLFSNSCETFLFTTFLYVMFKKLKCDTKSIFLDFGIGLILSFGFFVRASFLMFAFYPLFHVFIVMLVKLPLLKFLTKGLKMAISTIIGFIIGAFVNIMMDSYYFSDHKMFSLLVTPWNSIKYNTNKESLKEHGIHPRYLHLIVNMFLLYGPMYAAFLVTVSRLLFSCMKCRNVKTENVSQEIQIFMSGSSIIPILFLSAIPHQEPRFLLPMIVPMTFLFVCTINKQFYISFFSAWIVFNLLGVAWFGFLHQAGVTPVISILNKQLQYPDGKIHQVIFWKTYMPPNHLFGLSIDRKDVTILDLSGAPFSDVIDHLNSKDKVNISRDETFWFVVPNLLAKDLHNHECFQWRLNAQVFPHVSAETLPISEVKEFIQNISFSTTLDEVLMFLKDIFSLNLYVNSAA